MHLFIFLWQIVNVPIAIISYKDCGILISMNVLSVHDRDDYQEGESLKV
jgi:hypothetical protein